VLCGRCKKLPRTSLQRCYIFSGPSGSLLPALLSVENLVPLKPVLGGVSDVALIHYPSCTDTIKPNLQFSYNFVVIIASLSNWACYILNYALSDFLYRLCFPRFNWIVEYNNFKEQKKTYNIKTQQQLVLKWINKPAIINTSKRR
jgi:hypothetical protein